MVPQLVRLLLPPIPPMLLKLLLVHKSNAFFCPLYRPLYRSALILHHHLILPLVPLHTPPKYHINPFHNPPPHSHHSYIIPPSHYTPQPIHPPTPLPSNQHTPSYVNVSFNPSNPSFMTHNTPPSTLIALLHPVSPYPALLFISPLTLTYP